MQLMLKLHNKAPRPSVLLPCPVCVTVQDHVFIFIFFKVCVHAYYKDAHVSHTSQTKCMYED